MNGASLCAVAEEPEVEPWYSVRCVFAFKGEHQTRYEERVTLWRVASFEDAISRAEQEAREYGEDVGAEYLGFAQSFHLAVDGPLRSGDEVFSLIRESDLPPADYISRYFDTGTEFQGHLESD